LQKQQTRLKATTCKLRFHLWIYYTTGCSTQAWLNPAERTLQVSISSFQLTTMPWRVLKSYCSCWYVPRTSS